jgi:hypothetical protein
MLANVSSAKGQSSHEQRRSLGAYRRVLQTRFSSVWVTIFVLFAWYMAWGKLLGSFLFDLTTMDHSHHSHSASMDTSMEQRCVMYMLWNTNIINTCVV